MSPPFVLGQKIAVAGVGVREVRGIAADGSVTFREEEYAQTSELTLGPEEARRRVRPLVAKGFAEALHASLGEFAPPNLETQNYRRKKAYRAALQSNDLGTMTATLRSIYRHPSPDYPEEWYEDELEEVVFAELSAVLGVKQSDLKAQARRAVQRPVLRDYAEELAAYQDPPALDGYRPVGPFFVESTLAAGESRASRIEVPVRRGIWLGYFKEAAEDLLDPSELLVVHAERFHRVPELVARAERAPEELAIDGASMAVYDVQADMDPSFQRAIETAAHDAVAGRGVKVSLMGDGSGIAFIAREDARAVLISIDLV